MSETETKYTDQEKKEAKARSDGVLNLFKDNWVTADTSKYYDEWASTYDKDLDILGYIGPTIGGEYFAKYAKQLGIEKEARILDVAAGTGKCGEKLLKEHGFWNLEANDISEMMLDIARSKGLYKKFYVGAFADLALSEKRYDGILMVGYSNLRSVNVIVKLIKSGGLFVAVLNTVKRDTYQKYLDEMDKAGVWECLENMVHPQKLCEDYEAHLLVYKIL